MEKSIADEKLENALYLYRAEAGIGTDRYANAREYLAHVERYARVNQDWDVLAHVKLYQIRTELRLRDVAELSSDEIRSHLSLLYGHKPSPYVTEPFKLHRVHIFPLFPPFHLLTPL